MSGAQVSSSMPLNELYNMTTGATGLSLQHSQNELMQQQQDIGGHELEMGARLAGTLLSSYDTPEARAAAYPTLLAQARQVAPGYFKNAPATYPGDEPTKALARMGTPSQTQAEWGFNLAANKAYTAATTPPATVAAPASSTAPATGGDGLTGDKAHDLPLIAQRESGGSPTVLNYVAQQDPTAYARGATASGKYQIVNSTWREGMQLAGLDPAQYATARDAPEQVQDKVASAIYDKYGAKPWQKGPQDWVKDEQGRYQMATVRPPAGAPGGAPAIAPPGTLPGAPATPAPYRVASNAPVPPPVSTAPAAQPSYTDTETGLPVIGTQPGAPAATPQPQAQVPQPPANRAMPGAPDGPPAATPPPPVQPAPAGGPQPPQLAPLNAAGLTQVQQRQIDAMAANPTVPLKERMAAQQGFVNQNIQLQQKQFSDWLQVQQLQTSQGQLSVSQQNSALEYWKAAHPDAKVTMTGGEIITQNPRTGEEIAPRIQVTPQRADTAAMAIVSRLGPKVANGTATPDEQAQYAVAVDSYRQPVLRENPVTKETLRVNTRELPAGFPEPPSLGSRAPGAAGGGSNVVIPGYSPQQQEIERDPAKAKVADEQYGRDSKNVGDLTTGVTTAQNDNLRTKEMLDLLSNGDFSTGPGSETWARTAAWFQRWAPAGLTGWEKESANLRGPAAAQAFQKLAFQGVTTQEKESSPRGGILATQLFQRNNPGLDLLNPANKSLLDMKLIQNQANIDYGRGALGHFTTQETRYGDTHKYSSLEQFNTQWINQRNPQVYAAAMGAISGQPPEQWTKGLSDAEYNRALDIVSRANPSAIVNTKEGRKVMQPNAPPPPPPGFSVVR